jgi:hypothetical protein
MSSPTQHSLKLMRDRGYPLVQVVEKWIAPARKRVDLFGIIDIVCVGEEFGDTVGVQCTSDDHVSEHVRKVTDSPALPFLRKAGWRIVVQGWKKRCGRWVVREVDVS